MDVYAKKISDIKFCCISNISLQNGHRTCVLAAGFFVWFGYNKFSFQPYSQLLSCTVSELGFNLVSLLQQSVGMRDVD
jgi:hypothetical protein